MFVIARKTNGVTERLKDSNSMSVKKFQDRSDAHLLAQKLNENTLKEKQWNVEQIIR